MNRRTFLTSRISVVALSRMANACETQSLETEAIAFIGGASEIADHDSSGGYLVGLTQPGRGIKVIRLPAGGKLATRYASMPVGTISVAVNDEPACKVNVHSSGTLTSSYPHIPECMEACSLDWAMQGRQSGWAVANSLSNVSLLQTALIGGV